MYEQICKKTIVIAQQAGAFMQQERRNFDVGLVEQKDHNNLVSYVDRQTETLLVEALSKLVPEAGFITEEASITQTTSALNWVIDPLDGTTNFVHSFPLYGVNIALMEHQKVLVAVSFFPALNELFYAWHKGGCWLNNQRVFVRKHHTLKGALIAQGFPYQLGSREEVYFEVLKQVNKVTRGFRHTGCAALDLAYVACGRFDAYFEYGVYVWDIMPGILLVQEAGGNVSDFNNGNQFWDASEIVASGAVHPEIIQLLQLHRS